MEETKKRIAKLNYVIIGFFALMGIGNVLMAIYASPGQVIRSLYVGYAILNLLTIAIQIKIIKIDKKSCKERH